MLHKYSFEFYGTNGIIKRFNVLITPANFARMVDYFCKLPCASTILDGDLLAVYALKGKNGIIRDIVSRFNYML